MEMQYLYTAYYVEGDDGWVVAFAAEFPSIVTQGRTIDEAREFLRDAVESLIADNEQLMKESIEGRRILLVEQQTTGRPA